MSPWMKTLFSFLYAVEILGMLVPTILTLIPGEASKANHLGYFSRCSFAPWSTLSLVGITVLIVGIVYWIQLAVSTP